MSLDNFGNQLYVDGRLIEIPAAQDKVTVDITYTHDSKLVGIRLFLEDCKHGDYGTLTIEHPTDGELSRFGNTAYLPPGQRDIEVFVPEETAGSEVLANLIYRLKVNAIDTDGRKMIMWLITRK